MARLSVFWYTIPEVNHRVYWLGLTRRSVEKGTFVWDNGEQLSKEQAKYVLYPGAPSSDTPGYECIASSPDGGMPKEFYDTGCRNIKYYICEPYAAFNATLKAGQQ
ncbi:hypothetical protein ElyMa_003851600 [Elysia marginata]|uniref:C-type lectin domain-containing protein n=1 Tax=Elysia marginata TaxID=1093978 RepID=A0AAV4FKF7_9GAST|nr:hypothetical protein ElyMa_003851600 [Elysia marginata]